MKLFTQPQTSKREKKFKTVSNKEGLIIALVIVLGYAAYSQMQVAGDILLTIAMLLIIASFISGYARSDELQKLIQLKAAALSFVIVMIALTIAWTLEIYNIGTDMLLTSVFSIGFVAHLLLLPYIAKKINEK